MYRMSNRKDRILFALSHTQFASNLGSAVRAMNNMGFTRLALIQPECEVGAEARTYSMKGAGILDRAELHPSLQSLGEEADILVGTTARSGPHSTKWVQLRDFALNVLPTFPSSKFVIAFGSEGNGLRAEELRLCHWLVEIPTGEDSPVINLAQAVAIVAYELRACESVKSKATPGEPQPESVEALLAFVERSLAQRDLGKQVTVERIMERLSRIATRAQLETDDLNLLRFLLGKHEGKEH